jgi:hypothetical protein
MTSNFGIEGSSPSAFSKMKARRKFERTSGGITDALSYLGKHLI